MRKSDSYYDVRMLTERRYRLRDQLAQLPSEAWAKEATNRRRQKLAAQLRDCEAQLLEKTQMSLFPKNQRREHEIA